MISTVKLLTMTSVFMFMNVFGQNVTDKELDKKSKIYELTGNIQLSDIENANRAFVTAIPPDSFSNINGLYSQLAGKGTLRLKNAVLIINTIPDNKIMLSFHKLELLNSTIFLGSNDISIICNEYKQVGSDITSFKPENGYASDGADATSEGGDGSNGSEGLNSGSAFVFVTDKIVSPSGNINFNLWGQNGGQGGNGKYGKTGADGARGRNCSDGGYQCRRGNSSGHPGQNGGKGGNAGNGGNGGDAGKLEFRLHGFTEPYNHFFRFAGEGGLGNEPGTPGEGGKGGKGGRYGSTNCGRICEPYSFRNGPEGKRGSQGIEGIKGTDGNSQQLVKGNFNVQYLKQFLSSWGDPTKSIPENVEELSFTQLSGVQSK